MSQGINVICDNILFSLQKAGGASVVWTQHIKRLINDDRFDCRFIEYSNAQDNLFRNSVDIQEDKVCERKLIPVPFVRYINLKPLIDDRAIFHSSHYRLMYGKNLVNITTVHDFVYEKFRKGLPQIVHSSQKFNAIRKADGIICISENTKRDLLKFLPYVEKNKIRVIYNGVDEGYKVLDKYEYFEQFSIPFDKHDFLLYVGNRIDRYKNFNIVVEASKRLGVPLVMVGGGSLSDLEVSYLNAMIGEKSYCLFNHTSIEFLNYLYNSALVLLYLSSYEGFGIPIIEAQRAGCPVIAQNTSSISEVIGDYDYAINRLDINLVCDRVKNLRFKDERDRIVQQGLKNSCRFSWDKTYKETTDFYYTIYDK